MNAGSNLVEAPVCSGGGGGGGGADLKGRELH